MLVRRFLSRVLGAFLVIPLAVAVAPSWGEEAALKPWQEESVLAALQDPAISVRHAAVLWLSVHDTPRQFSSDALAKALTEFLSRDDTPPQIRHRAAHALAGYAGSAAGAFVSQLAPLVSDPDHDVRAGAVETLCHLGAPSVAAAPQVAALLKHPDREVRIYSAELLGCMGPAAAAYAPRLAAVLEAVDRADVYGAAAGSLLKLGTAASPYLRQITNLLVNPNEDVRIAVASALRSSRSGPEAVELIAGNPQWVNSSDPHIRQLAAKAAGDLAGVGRSSSALATQIAPLLQDKDRNVRKAAAEALGKMGPAGAPFAAQIAELLKDTSAPQGPDDVSIRGVAVEALGSLGSASTPFVPRIVALLRDPWLGVRSAAEHALGQMGRAAVSALPQLTAMLADPDARVRVAGAAALGQMGPLAAPAAAQLVGLLKDAVPDVQNRAAEALGKIGAPAAPVVPQILELLTDSHPRPIQIAAGQALAEMPAAVAAAPAPVAALLYQSKDPSVRFYAVKALSHLGPQAAPYAAHLAALLKESDAASVRLRPVVLESLGALGSAASAAVPQLAALLRDANPATRQAAARSLGEVGPGAAGVAGQLAGLLRDRDPGVRAAAAEALGELGQSSKAVPVPLLAAAMGDADLKVRTQLLAALDHIVETTGPLKDRAVMLDCLSASQAVPAAAADFLLRAYLYRKLDAEDLTLIHWLGNRKTAERPAVAVLTHQETVTVLTAFKDGWQDMQAFHGLRKDLADRMAELISNQAWELPDMPLLAALETRVAPVFPARAHIVQAILDRNVLHRRIQIASLAFAAHFLAWCALLIAYPRRRWLQRFVWNPWVRWILGAGYVGVLIGAVPVLRRWMMRPFRPYLIPVVDLPAYFPDCEVLQERNKRMEPGRLLLSDALPAISGEVVLKGQAGVGKTLALLRLALAARAPVVFLRASECTAGVVAAIHKKLKGQIKDVGFLRALVNAGALKVLIDGLNEALPAARSHITQFLEEEFKGDFVLSTQPTSWEPPPSARVYVLQALMPEQIEPFLLKQWEALKDRATLDQARYKEAVARYLQAIGPHPLQDAANGPRVAALSNPMDATLAAELLARGKIPDVFRLVEQRYQAVAAEFREREGREFPARRFSDRVYEWRKSGEPDINPEGFEAELAALGKDRLMVERTEVIRLGKGDAPINRWCFRHDKVMDYFLLPSFMGENTRRLKEHDTDEQFWGIYDLLAVRLADDEEKELHEFLMDRAADSNRNELVNRYTLARRLRALMNTGRPVVAPWQVAI